MPSFATNLQRKLADIPNLFSIGHSAAVVFLGLLAAGLGKAGADINRKMLNQAKEIRENSARLKREQHERLTEQGKTEDLESVEIAKTTADSARHAAKIARMKAPIAIQKAKSKRREEVRKRKTESQVTVVKENTKADFSVVKEIEAGQISKVKARGQQEVKREHEQGMYAMKQQETTHETKRATNVQKHHDSMTDLNTKRADATQLAATSVEKNTVATNKVTQAVLRLNVASSAAHDSRLKLIKAMNEYDRALVNDNLTEDKEKALQVAYLENLPIERNLETQLAISKVNAESEDLQDIMVELAIGETSLNEALENCSPGTRAKLLKIHESEIPKEKAPIVQNTQKDQEQSIEQRLANLGHDPVPALVQRLKILQQPIEGEIQNSDVPSMDKRMIRGAN